MTLNTRYLFVMGLVCTPASGRLSLSVLLPIHQPTDNELTIWLTSVCGNRLTSTIHLYRRHQREKVENYMKKMCIHIFIIIDHRALHVHPPSAISQLSLSFAGRPLVAVKHLAMSSHYQSTVFIITTVEYLAVFLPKRYFLSDLTVQNANRS